MYCNCRVLSEETAVFLQQYRIHESWKGCTRNSIYCSWMIGQLVLDHSRMKCCTNWTTIRWMQQAHPKRPYLYLQDFASFLKNLSHIGVFSRALPSIWDGYIPFRFWYQNFVFIFNLSHSPFMSSWFYSPNNVFLKRKNYQPRYYVIRLTPVLLLLSHTRSLFGLKQMEIKRWHICLFYTLFI